MKRILVAIDASDRASVVLGAAARLAGLVGAKLVVYRAVGIPPDFPRTVVEMTDARLEEVLLANAYEDLHRLTRDLAPNLVEKHVAVFATPWDGICRAAREHAADLVVIGSHGYGGLDRVLGTTAAKVVNHLDRNVLVVRAAI